MTCPKYQGVKISATAENVMKKKAMPRKSASGRENAMSRQMLDDFDKTTDVLASSFSDIADVELLPTSRSRSPSVLFAFNSGASSEDKFSAEKLLRRTFAQT